MINLAKSVNLKDWPGMRSQIETNVKTVLGAMPSERVELQTKTVDELQFPNYVRRRVNYFVDEWERVSAWLFIPERKDEVPGILCCHQQVPQGKDEPAGLEGEGMMAFAQHYAELGYVTLAPDVITAGDRISSGLAAFDTRSFYKDNPKMSALGKMLADHVCAIDVLCEAKRVDSARIGVIGHGLGGHNALLLAAFDERVQACVTSCGFTRFAADKAPERWARDNGFVCLPLLREAIKTRQFPFDWEHILSLIAPCPTLVVASPKDELFSNTQSCEKAVELAKGVYRLLGAQDALHIYTHEDGHRMTPEVLQVCDEWFDRWL